VSEAVITADQAAVIPDTNAPARPKRRWVRLLVMLSVPLLLALAGGYYWLNSGRYVSTDNAYVQQDKVTVSAEVAGPIMEVLVRENQRVRRGDVLFRIDPRPFRIALAQAEAQLHAAQVQVTQLETQVAGTGGDIAGARANLVFTQRALDRQQELLGRGFTTRARYDEALHAVQEARERLANAQADASRARSALRQGPVSNQPAIEAAMVARERALLDLRRTEVRAPSDGIVTQAQRLQVGNAAVPGLAVVTIVRSGDVWVEANFKETDLARMEVGQSVEVELDAYPDLPVHGRVASIGAGTGSQFSVIPAQNASGNWVKVTQRVPVRIAIEGRPARPLIAGLSADVTVDTGGEDGGRRIAAAQR
jgi:membrane fusion protein (multidrug efflux system)